MNPQTLDSYVSGHWTRGEGVETSLVDPVSGEMIATASAKGVDLKRGLAFARRQGHAALARAELCRAGETPRRRRRCAHRQPRQV